MNAHIYIYLVRDVLETNQQTSEPMFVVAAFYFALAKFKQCILDFNGDITHFTRWKKQIVGILEPNTNQTDTAILSVFLDSVIWSRNTQKGPPKNIEFDILVKKSKS